MRKRSFSIQEEMEISDDLGGNRDGESSDRSSVRFDGIDSNNSNQDDIFLLPTIGSELFAED
jgi:hypothetical protein